MKLDLDNKIAIVTGAAQGLGKAISLALAAENATVVVVDRDAEKAAQVFESVNAIHPGGMAITADVSSAADVEQLIRQTMDAYGRIDILVNNAGICPRTDFSAISEEEWERVLAVNLKSVFLLSQAVFPHMKAQGYGRILNMASGAGKVGGIQVGAHYSASKAAVICLTKTLALEGARYGITANAVSPGVIDTEMSVTLPEAQLEHYRTMIPLGRLGDAQDVANMVLFLVSGAAAYVTGEISDVNGGLIMD